MKTANSDKISETHLIKLKKRYDEGFILFWAAHKNFPIFNPISIKEFRKRLDNPDFFEKFDRLD